MSENRWKNGERVRTKSENGGRERLREKLGRGDMRLHESRE